MQRDAKTTVKKYADLKTEVACWGLWLVLIIQAAFYGIF